MGLELDYKWSGWYGVEQAMLVIYFFELSVRLKRWRFEFFYHKLDSTWNLLDFVIVMGGVVEQWMMPIITLLRSLVSGEPVVETHATNVLPILRMMRLLRILRLIRLLKSFRPLYKLALGVLEAMQAMQWVMVLAVILLYASSILFTTLVGHALIPGGGVTEEAQELFGTVTESMFSLFLVMNGDQGPMEPLFATVPLRVLCVTYVVVSNWALLATLTAVVSETMISTTRENERQEDQDDRAAFDDDRRSRLKALFMKLDKDGTGTLIKMSLTLCSTTKSAMKTFIMQQTLKGLTSTICLGTSVSRVLMACG